MKRDKRIINLMRQLDIDIDPGMDQQILDSAQERLTIATNTPSAVSQSGAWRIIMKSPLTKLAVATVMAITVTALFHQIGRPIDQVVWGDELSARLKTIPCFSYRMVTEFDGPLPEGKPVRVEARIYYSETLGVRKDMYERDRLVMTYYSIPRDKICLVVTPHSKKVLRRPYSSGSAEKEDPRRLVSEFPLEDQEPLGETILDGIEVVGRKAGGMRIKNYQTDDTEACLWLDKATGLPHLIEIRGTAAQESMQIKTTFDRFDWALPVDPLLFEPNIPADYQVEDRKASVVNPELAEEQLLAGLRVFSQRTGGIYPSSLSGMTMVLEFGQHKPKKLGEDTSKNTVEDVKTTFLALTRASRAYATLAQKHADVAYYGKSIKATDTKSILLRWQSAENQYRVIFGDLRVEELSAEHLAELEMVIQNP
ncbi:hypothetical protein ACFL6U_00795 [Planctomycetota bacterium]